MRTFGIIMLCILAVIGGGIAWWASQTPTYVHRYRLTIEAEVGGVLRSGASVIEVRTTDYKAGLPETKGLRSRVIGDAVFLDLGRGQNVIALLGFNPHGAREMIDLLDFHVFRASNPRLQIEDLPKLTGRAPLPDNLMPTLITFSDLNDPKSAKEVGFTEFERVFGADVHFKGVWIEMTNVGVTRGIEKKLLWWNNAGRPAADAYHAWRAGRTTGTAIEPETLFKRG
jgi:hypothetical protein